MTSSTARQLVDEEPRRRASYLRSSFPATAEVRRDALTCIALMLGLAPSAVRPEALLVEDLGATSLQMVEIAIAFEERFGVDIHDDEIERMRSVGDALGCLEWALWRRRGP